MKLERSLIINKVPRPLIDERIVLDYFAPGRAQFTVSVDDDAPIVRNHLVTFDMGYTGQATLQRWFIGVVDRVVAMGGGRFRVVCSEIASALSRPIALSLRHVSVRDVVEELTKITGLRFATPDVAYSKKKVANFYSVGSGYQVMDAIGRVFAIDDYLWQQQGGIIYIGSWADSRWAALDDFNLPDNLFDEQLSNESARVAAIPQLRPGMVINGHRLTSIEFSKNHMSVSWSNQ